MRTVIKRLVMFGYCHGWFADAVVERLFAVFNLSEA